MVHNCSFDAGEKPRGKASGLLGGRVIFMNDIASAPDANPPPRSSRKRVRFSDDTHAGDAGTDVKSVKATVLCDVGKAYFGLCRAGQKYCTEFKYVSCQHSVSSQRSVRKLNFPHDRRRRRRGRADGRASG